MTVHAVFVVGPQRAGTTLIYEMLRQAGSGIYINRLEKEDFYFLKCSSPNLPDWQQRQWGQGEPQVVVDVNPLYFGHPEVIDAICATVPDAHFVYVHRNEPDRERSFRQHQRLNSLAAPVLGYQISDELYETQSDFATAEAQLIERIRPERLLRLDFADLHQDGGALWRDSLGSFLGLASDLPDVGQVNAQRRHDLLRHRVFFALVRVAQLSRVHILLRRARLSRVTDPEMRRLSEALVGA